MSRQEKLLVAARDIELEAEFIEHRCNCPKQAEVFRLIAQRLRQEASHLCQEKALDSIAASDHLLAHWYSQDCYELFPSPK